jgi:hypothetical protein
MEVMEVMETSAEAESASPAAARMRARLVRASVRVGLGPDGRRVSTRQIPDFAVRLAARFRDPSLREITPALGRRNRHSTGKARRVLDWQPRPARQTVLDCARSLIALGAIQDLS